MGPASGEATVVKAERQQDRQATIVVPIKNKDGHHLIFPREFILFFQRAGCRVVVVADEDCRSLMPLFDHFSLPGVEVRYRKFRKVDPSGIAKIDGIVRETRATMVFFPTLDEWLTDLYLYTLGGAGRFGDAGPLLTGVLHYVAKKGRSGLARRAFDRLQLFCARLVLRSGRIAPLFALSAAMADARIGRADLAWAGHLVQLPHPLVVHEGRRTARHPQLRVIIFGDIRDNKSAASVLACWSRVVQQGKTPYTLMIAGTISDSLQKIRIEREVRDMPPAVRAGVEIVDRFVSEAEKTRLFDSADVVLLPCVGEDYRQGMNSGVLFDAIAFAKPVIYSEVLEGVPGIGDIGVRFSVGDEASLLDALEKVAAHYAQFEGNIRRRATAHRADFDRCLERTLGAAVTVRKDRRQEIRVDEA